MTRQRFVQQLWYILMDAADLAEQSPYNRAWVQQAYSELDAWKDRGASEADVIPVVELIAWLTETLASNLDFETRSVLRNRQHSLCAQWERNRVDRFQDFAGVLDDAH